MHILYVAHAYKPAYRLGGPVWSISALAEGMAARGHQVTVFATNGNADEDLDVPTDRPIDVDGVAVRYFQRTEPFRQYLPRLKYLSQSIGYLYTPDLLPVMQSMLPTVDVVHTQMPFVYPTQAAARVAIAHKVPLFYSQRGVFDPARLQYDGEYQNEQAHSGVFRQHLDAVAAFLEPHFCGKTLVEVGCGKGFFLQMLRQRG